MSVASEPLFFPNGSAITADGSTLVVSESFGNRMSAFDIAADGSLGPRRDWAALGAAPTSDDVATVLGCGGLRTRRHVPRRRGRVWVADAVGNRVVRLAEGGEILDEIATGEGCFACMLGGDDGRTLFLCVAPDFYEDARSGRTARAASWPPRSTSPTPARRDGRLERGWTHCAVRAASASSADRWLADH